MKNSFHLMIIFFICVPASFCSAMVNKVLVHNDSYKEYEAVWREKSHELPIKANRLISLAPKKLLSEDGIHEEEVQSEANRALDELDEFNIEFYDTTDPYYKECKKHKFFSFILYSQIKRYEDKKVYTAKLQLLRPHGLSIRELTVNICGIETLKLIIADNIKDSELKFDD